MAIRGHPAYMPGFPMWILIFLVKRVLLLAVVEHRAQQSL